MIRKLILRNCSKECVIVRRGLSLKGRGGCTARHANFGTLTILLVLLACVGCGPALCHREKGASLMTAKERTGLVTMKGAPITLLGPAIKAGEKAPDFRVVNADFKPVRLSDFAGQVLLIAAVPSLDTGVCSAETKRFNNEAAKLPGDVRVLTISMDLPFAQKRFCEAENVKNVEVLSDHVWREFGLRYGVLIKDMGLLTRSIFVVGRDGRIAYVQIVPEITQHPDYDAALAAARKASGK